MCKRLLIEEKNGVTKTALIDGSRLTELFIDREENGSLVGRIILGSVQNILPSRFAFIDIGREKNAFMNMPPGLTLKRGQPVPVQVNKDAYGTKGAYVGTELHFNGRLVILHAGGDIGVSHKITDPHERERLKKLVRRNLPDGIGAIIRTNCEGKAEDEIKTEIGRLLETLYTVTERAKYAKPPVILHKENPLLADLLSDDISEIWADGGYTEVSRAVAIASPGFAGKVLRFDSAAEGRGLFDAFNLPSQIEKALRKVVRLPSGGFITIEQTEACAVVDVNTGQFTGKAEYRETVVQTNTEAALVLAEQIVLRNLSGIIIVDFIDMSEQSDRQALIQTVEQAVKHHRIKTDVIGITELGLMQLTRKKTREPLSRLLTLACDKCGGTGRIAAK
jgi:ribonuclease G